MVYKLLVELLCMISWNQFFQTAGHTRQRGLVQMVQITKLLGQEWNHLVDQFPHQKVIERPVKRISRDEIQLS